MPFGGTTPEQDKKIDRCVNNLTTKGRKRSSAIAICKASVIGKESVEDIIKRLEGGDKMKKNTFNESLAFSVQEGSINEDKRTVRVCALAPCISANDRYYSPAIVESVSGTLKGKKSYADHDMRDVEHLIGKIVGESFVDGKLFADIKLSKRGIAGDTWEKIKDGTIDSVSIAANGKAKEVEIDGRTVTEVTELKIKSVDFVPEGGIKDAKVMQVFEKEEDIPKTKEVKKKMIENVKQLKEEYPDLVAEIEEDKNKEVTEATKKVTKLEKELSDIKMKGIKEAEIAKLETTDAVKAILKERVTGSTEDEVKASVKKEFEFIQSVAEATKEEAEINGIVDSEAGKKKKKEGFKWTRESIKTHASIPDDLKEEATNVLLYQGSKAMLEHLEKQGVKL